MALTFDVVDQKLGWLAEVLRETHGYLGPDDDIFYPTVVYNPGSSTIEVEARSPGATPTLIDESDRADLQAIIDAHDGSPPADIQAEQTEEDNARTRASDAIQTLENAHANWGSLTNAQKDSALKLVVIVVAKIGRLILRKFDA